MFICPPMMMSPGRKLVELKCNKGQRSRGKDFAGMCKGTGLKAHVFSASKMIPVLGTQEM